MKNGRVENEIGGVRGAQRAEAVVGSVVARGFAQ